MTSESSSTFTPKNVLPSDRELMGHTFPVWSPTKDEEDELYHVLRRTEQEMLPHQQQYHQEFDDADDIYEAKITPQLNRTSIRIPWSFTVIDAALAEEIDAFPDIEIDTQEDDDKPKLPALNAAKKYALGKANWEKVKIDARRICRIYGWCAVRQYYARETRLITEEVPEVQADGSVKIVERQVWDYPKDDIMFEVIDNPRRFLIDDSARDIDDAEDCALYTEVNWNVFRQMVQHDSRFKNVQYVVPGNDYYFSDKGSFIQPESATNVARDRKVKLLEYWNKVLDRYVMVANGVIIRSRSLVDAHKELPFAAIHLYRRPHTFYSKGIPKILESVEAPYNAIISAEIQATKLSFPILVTAEDSGIDPKAVAPYPGIVLEGALDKMKLMELGEVPQEAYRSKEKLEQLIVWITGVNYQQLFSQQQSDRVGIESLKRETMLSRINANIRENEVGFIVRMGNLLIQNIMYYYTAPRLRRLLSDEEADKMDGLRFERDDKQVAKDSNGKVIGVLERRKIPVPNISFEETKNASGVKLTSRKSSSTGFLLARPEYIRTKYDLDIRAVRPSAMSSSKEARKLLMLELSNHALDVNGAIMQQGATQGPPGPDGVPTTVPGKPLWNQEYIERMVAEVNELSVEKAIHSGEDEEQDSAQGALEKIAGPLMSTFQASPEMTVEQKFGPRRAVPPQQQAQAEFENIG